MLSLEDLRDRMNLFVKERDWNKFHLPCNILLALLGEVGEVAECFQWKGSMDDFVSGVPAPYFSSKEVEHVGEEIADVVIYTTRLAEELRVDLGAAVSNRINHSLRQPNSVQMAQAQAQAQDRDAAPSSSSASKESASTATTTTTTTTTTTRWSACNFTDVHSFSKTLYQTHRQSPRYFALTLSTVSARLAGLFSRRPESDTLLPWQRWEQQDTTELADALVDVFLCMGGLASVMGLDLAKCASDKIVKNCVRYPALAVKGSSAKYTAYTASDGGTGSNNGTKLSTSQQPQTLVSSSAALIFAGVLGTFAGLFIARKGR